MPLIYYLPVILFIAAGVLLSALTKKLTIPGAIAGGMVATLIFAGAGYTGVAMLTVFFICGTLATSWHKNEKLQFEVKADQFVKRNTGQVLANGGMAAITGVLIYLFPNKTELFRLVMAASLASAVADTLSSELGMVYGKRFYNIINWKRDKKGLDGVISFEGTLIGITGSVLIAVIYAIGFGFNITFIYIIVAGTIGNLSDSVLGALFERKHYIGNDMVNFLNTFIAALAIWLSIIIF